jgi:hypothetical protein
LTNTTREEYIRTNLSQPESESEVVMSAKRGNQLWRIRSEVVLSLPPPALRIVYCCGRLHDAEGGPFHVLQKAPCAVLAHLVDLYYTASSLWFIKSCYLSMYLSMYLFHQIRSSSQFQRPTQINPLDCTDFGDLAKFIGLTLRYVCFHRST